MEELKPCPFCGGRIYVFGKQARLLYHVMTVLQVQAVS